MTRKSLVILGIAVFGMIAAVGCARSPESGPEVADLSKMDPESPGRSDRVPPGRGERDRGPGRRFGPAWALSDRVILTEEEKEFLELTTAPVVLRPMRDTLEAMGKVLAHPMGKAIVNYAFPARISDIHVRVGDWVRAGRPLVSLQSEEVGTAKSAFYKAEADFELAQSSHEREKRLFDRGVGAQKNLMVAEAELKSARAELNAAEKKLHVLGFTQEQVRVIAETHQISPSITLHAPLAGRVAISNAILGAMVDQTTEILVLINPDVLCVDAEIFEKDIARVRQGQIVRVSVPAYPGEVFEGNLCHVGDIMNEETRTVTIRTEVANPEHKLKPGMFASVRIQLNGDGQVLAVPAEAVLEEGDARVVFVKREGEFVPRLIRTGIKEDGFLEVLEGLEPGDVVVTRGHFQLKSKLLDDVLKSSGHTH